MSESDKSRKYALECLRLESDCFQLMGGAHTPALRSHFLRMAGVWRAHAERGPGQKHPNLTAVNHF
jgi:hypothetical protein